MNGMELLVNAKALSLDVTKKF